VNKIVQAWERHHARPVDDGRDAITIDGVKVSLDNPKLVESKMGLKNAPKGTKACVNQHAVVEEALFGDRERVSSLFHFVDLTIKRLRIRRRHLKVATPFTGSPRGSGDRPHLHDTRRWLDAIDKSDEYAEDRDFLMKLYLTLKNRLG
jgi:hypothetical protein